LVLSFTLQVFSTQPSPQEMSQVFWMQFSPQDVVEQPVGGVGRVTLLLVL
jgi:hypothetical protein